MRDRATQVVMDIPLYGSETIGQMLDAFQDRFSLIAAFQQLWMQRGGTLQSHRRRCQPTRRRSLLKPRPKRRICTPTGRRPQAGRSGQVVRIPTPGGQLAELALPLDTGDTERRAAVEQVMSTHAGPGNPNLPRRRVSARLVETPTWGPKGERDFPWGQ